MITLDKSQVIPLCDVKEMFLFTLAAFLDLLDTIKLGKAIQGESDITILFWFSIAVKQKLSMLNVLIICFKILYICQPIFFSISVLLFQKHNISVKYKLVIRP